LKNDYPIDDKNFEKRSTSADFHHNRIEHLKCNPLEIHDLLS